MAAASYYSGQKLYSEYDREWKYPHSDSSRVLYTEIMLPPNAPPQYANRQTLWNAVDAAEKQMNAQTARRLNITLPRELTFEQNLELIRDYCREQFVNRGMICDLCFHDSGNGNPHVHLMLSMRAMDENGCWLPKTRTEYVLDENGNRIKDRRGRWKRERIDTVDWNEQKYCEIWRHEWELAQNAALEKAGCPERIDMRSFERQGITDQAPQVHLGPSAAALERRGVRTYLGDQNREIGRVNSLIDTLQKTVKALSEWIDSLKAALSQQEIIENPGDHPLSEVLMTYLDMRKQERESWAHRAQTKASIRDLEGILNAVSFLKSRNVNTVNVLGEQLNAIGGLLHEMRRMVRANESRMRDIDAILNADETIRRYAPVIEEYNKIFFKGAKEKYAIEHKDELEAVRKARRLLYKLSMTQPIDRKALKAEAAQLKAENESLRQKLDLLQSEMDELKQVRYWVRKVIPDALPAKGTDGRVSLEGRMESNKNKDELDLLMENAADLALGQQQIQTTLLSEKPKEVDKDHEHR